MVIDARGGELFNDLFEGLDELKKQGGDYKILFLECSDQVLARRYKETRRQHPLAEESGGSVMAGHSAGTRAAQARPLPHGLPYRYHPFVPRPAQASGSPAFFWGIPRIAMVVQCMSFGFKYGYPAEADLVLDVRCLPNPFYVDELKQKTGLDAGRPPDYVLEREETAGLAEAAV